MIEPTTVLPTRSDYGSWRQLFPYQFKKLALKSGAGMTFVDEGSGNPILMVHGNPTWSFYFHPLVNGLRQKYRCLAVDHVGCGMSDKPQRYPYHLNQHIQNLVELVDNLDLRNVTLVAHDWGGAIGLGAVKQRLDRFRKIILMNTAAFPPPFFPLRIRLCRFPLIGSWAVRRFNLFARAAISMATNRKHGLSKQVSDGLLAPYDSWQNRVAIDNFVRDIPTQSSQATWKTLEAIEGFLPGVNIPKLLIWGMKDWCFRPECLDRFLRIWPDAEVVRFPDAGHYVMLDQSDEVLTAISEFLGDPSE